MGSNTVGEYTSKIREICNNVPDRVIIMTNHIENKRRWRGIKRFHIEQVLKNGSVSSVRGTDRTVFWRGYDVNGRELELQVSLEDKSGSDTLVIKDAYKVRVGTAYDPNIDDRRAMEEWLKENPDYQKTADGKNVERRVKIEKI